MRRFLNTTRGRLTLVWVALFAAALAIANGGLYVAATFTANDRLNHEVRDQVLGVASGLHSTDGGVRYAGGSLPHESPRGVLVDVAVVGPRGLVLPAAGQPVGEADLVSLAAPTLRTGRPELVDFTDAEQVHRRAYVARVPQVNVGEPLAVVASTPLTDVELSIMRTMVLAAVFSVAALAGSAVLVHWLIGRVLSPVSQIATLAESLSERELHRRVEVRAPDDEVGQLVRTFNRMLARLEASFTALRSFTADASHELRSPLALMATELEYALARPRPPAERERALRVLQDEVRQMAGTVERLLLLARADAGQLRPDLRPLDVADFVHETVARWLATAEAGDVDFDVRLPDSGSVLADRGLARRILDNLLDNAIRHSPAGGRVRVAAERSGDRWRVVVADQGPGIPPELRERAFERFARADAARAREGDEGAGLGLPLSRAFARVQGGELDVVEEPGWGAVLRLRLPDAGPAHGV